jgi:hypothetical protein
VCCDNRSFMRGSIVRQISHNKTMTYGTGVGLFKQDHAQK